MEVSSNSIIDLAWSERQKPNLESKEELREIMKNFGAIAMVETNGSGK
jgi:hypothetical protein